MRFEVEKITCFDRLALMKSIVSLSLFAFILMITGCASTDSKNAADAPVMETQTPPQDPAATPPTTSVSPVETAPTETPSAPSDGAIIPLKDIPTYKGYPFAIKTKWAGLVKSPYAQDKQVVDVGSTPKDTPMRCPHTGKIFIVP
jgi:hypothetical protein